VDPIPWRRAWQQALYGPGGFYRGASGPAGHFSTAAQGLPGRVLAEALWGWADRLGCEGIIDLGAGRGELLRHLGDARPGHPLAGVDVVERPEGLTASTRWLVSPGGQGLPDELSGVTGTLVVAHEWLDVVPCTLAEVDGSGVPRELLVDPQTGACVRGGRLRGDELRWCERFWPSSRPGDRVEVGLARDLAWTGLLDRMESGAALAVDYGHRVGDRPRDGTFAAYRSGVRVRPTPDGSCDLTAHVAVDSLRHIEILTQRDALRQVGVTGRTPEHGRSRVDPPGYLRDLARASAEATLVAPGGFGDFLWVVARVGTWSLAGPGSRSPRRDEQALVPTQHKGRAPVCRDQPQGREPREQGR